MLRAFELNYTMYKMSVNFKLDEHELCLPDAVASDILYLLNRPKEARRMQGEWDFDTLTLVYGRLVKLRNIENVDFVDSKPKTEKTGSPYIKAYLDELATIVKLAIKADKPLCFN